MNLSQLKVQRWFCQNGGPCSPLVIAGHLQARRSFCVLRMKIDALQLNIQHTVLYIVQQKLTEGTFPGLFLRRRCYRNGDLPMDK